MKLNLAKAEGHTTVTLIEKIFMTAAYLLKLPTMGQYIERIFYETICWFVFVSSFNMLKSVIYLRTGLARGAMA